MKKKLLILNLLCITVINGIFAQKPELILPVGHPLNIRAIAYTPDGKYIVTGADDNTIKLWDVSSCKELKTFSGHQGSVNSVICSSDGKYIVSGSGDETIKLWDINTGLVIKTFNGHQGDVSSLALSPDEKYIASGSYDKTVKIWDLNTGKMVCFFEDHGWINSVAFSPDGKHIVTGLYDKTVNLWDIKKEKVIKSYKEHQSAVTSVAFSPDGKYIVSGSYDNTVKLWDIKKLKSIKTYEGHLDDVNSVTFSPDGKYILSGSYDGTAKLWEVSSGNELKTFFYKDEVNYVTFSPNGKNIATTSWGTIKIWDVITGLVLNEFSRSLNFLHNLENYKSDLLLLGDNLSFFDFENGKHKSVKQIKPEYLIDNFIAIKNDSIISLYNLDNDKIELSYSVKGGTINRSFKSSTHIRYIDEEKEGVYTYHIYNKKTGKEVNIEGIKRSSILISNDGNYIAGETDDPKCLKLIDTETGQAISIKDDTKVSEFLFSPDGKYIVTADKQIKLWNINSGIVVKTYKGHEMAVMSLAFSPDGKYIASGSGDKTVKLWEVNSGKELETYWGHKDAATIVTFSPNGKYIASMDLDHLLKIWDVENGKELNNFNNIQNYSLEGIFSSCSKYLILREPSYLKIWDIEKNIEINRIDNFHAWSIMQIHNKKYVIARSFGFFKVLRADNYKELLTFYSIGKDDWVVTTSDGRFDASQFSMDKMYYVSGLNIIPLSSLMEGFYTPGLWKRTLEEEIFEELDIKMDDIKLPPLTRIISPSSVTKEFLVVNKALKSTNQEIEVTVEVTDMGGGVDEILLYQNGKLISTSIRGFKSIVKKDDKNTKSFSVSLIDGENRLKAVAISNQRVESLPHEILINYTASELVKPNMYIFAAGINEYLNPRYNLNYAKNDASAFVKALQEGASGIFDKVIVSILNDSKATRVGIISEIQKIKSQSRPEDVFVFYYAGHGVMSSGNETEKPEFYLVPHDVTKMYEADIELKEKGISAKEIGEFSKNILSQKQLFVLDACQSGGAVKSFAMRGAAEEKAIAQLSRSTGTYFIAASGTEQFATEVATLGHGIFTYSIIEALKGVCKSQDGRLTVNLLKSCVEGLVPELSRKHKGSAQFPTGYGFGQDFPIVIVKE